MSLAAESIGSLAELPDAQVVEIRARRGWIAIDWRELIHFRELLFFLIWRDVKVRYKQTVLGVGWAVLQPVFNVILFSVVFGTMAGFDKKVSEPYPLWQYASILPWTLIATAITTGGLSLVTAQNLLTKIYFPRLFVPAASVGGALMDMVISAGCFLVLAAFYGFHAHLSWTVFLTPLLVIPTVMIGLGMAYILAAVTVLYRDFRFVIPFMAMAMMYGSAVMIPLPGLKLHWQLLLGINPVFGLEDAWRSVIFGEPWRIGECLISLATGTGIFVLGLFYFRRTERRFADIA